ncbi:hypothetical protein ASD58_27840 [Duganella sp. Root1480D1]|nr:hypothetical protein ASD58_27840 [Duganella sp. Root1480D1]
MLRDFLARIGAGVKRTRHGFVVIWANRSVGDQGVSSFRLRIGTFSMKLQGIGQIDTVRNKFLVRGDSLALVA